MGAELLCCYYSRPEAMHSNGIWFIVNRLKARNQMPEPITLLARMPCSLVHDPVNSNVMLSICFFLFIVDSKIEKCYDKINKIQESNYTYICS